MPEADIAGSAFTTITAGDASRAEARPGESGVFWSLKSHLAG